MTLIGTKRQTSVPYIVPVSNLQYPARTIFIHARLQALIKSARLTLIATADVDDTTALVLALVVDALTAHLTTDTALEESTTTVA